MVISTAMPTRIGIALEKWMATQVVPRKQQVRFKQSRTFIALECRWHLARRAEFTLASSAHRALWLCRQCPECEWYDWKWRLIPVSTASRIVGRLALAIWYDARFWHFLMGFGLEGNNAICATIYDEVVSKYNTLLLVAHFWGGKVELEVKCYGSAPFQELGWLQGQM